jgi:hypothetical protein
MKHSLLFQILIVLLSGSLVACATTERTPDEAAYEGGSRHNDCISQTTIRDYQVLDDSNLIVTAAVKRKYHVELSRRAFGLRSSWNIGFRSSTGSVCAGFGELIVDNGVRPERIRIASIRRLSPDDVDDLLIRFGKKEPEFEQTPAPEEIDGAEVEELD